MQNRNKSSSNIYSLILGLLIILFGIIILINLYLKFIDSDLLLRWWPVALILIGLLIASSGNQQVGLGAAIALAGTVIVLGRLDLLGDELRRFIELIVILLIGLSVITPIIIKKPNNP